MQLKRSSMSMLCGMLLASSSMAAVSPEEAAKLGVELTPMGGEMAGNADGTIPAWSGDLITPPASFKPGDNVRPNPWPDEKPYLVITKANMAEHADKLTDGSKALLEKYGDDGYVMNIYPSHRSMAVAPQWLYDNTAKNAVNATLEQDGLQLVNASAGIPFPIPQNGVEVMWNHLLKWQGTHRESQYDTYYLDKGGKPILSSSAIVVGEVPYYNPDKTYGVENAAAMIRIDFSAPARRAGEKQLIIDPTDFSAGGRKAWQYLKGQRRVRQAPTIAFDTPNSGNAGIGTYDDGFLFNGSPERYDWKLLGKQEMYVPYNNNALNNKGTVADLGPKFINPEINRWELHRVWVVEATLKEGERHIYQRRKFYVDEDAWVALSSEAYDVSGDLWRVGYTYPIALYDVPTIGFSVQGHYDLLGGIYYLAGLTANYDGIETDGKQKPAKYFSSSGLSKSGIR